MGIRTRCGGAIVASVLAGGALAPGAGAAIRVLAPVRISGASPFPPACAARAGIGIGSVQFGAEVEPSLALDPLDPRVIVAEYQQDRITTGSSLGDVVSVSRDGGRSFRQQLLPGTSACEGGAGLGTDPVLTIGPDGVAYASSQLGNGYTVSRSSDLGRSWQTGWATHTPGAPLLGFDDKDSMIADPARPGRVYLAWDAFFGLQGVGFLGGLVTTMSVVASADGARSWGGRRAAYQPLSPIYSEAGPQLVVAPRGELVLLFGVHQNQDAIGLPDLAGELVAIRSYDAGRSWSAPVAIASVPPRGSEVNDPGTGACIRTLGDCPGNHISDGLAAAAEPGGAIDAIWQQDESPHSGVIMLSRSIDGGVHWSAPRAIVHRDTQAFLPAIAVAPSGRIGVSYDAFRHYQAGDRVLNTDIWMTTSSDHGRSFRVQTRLAGPFDFRRAPVSATESVGRFLGDYQGMVAFADGFGVDFAASAPMARQGASDVFFSRMVIGSKRR